MISPTPTSSSKCGGANDRFPPQAGQPASAEWRSGMGDFVEKVEKSSVTKTRQTAIRWNIAAQHHLRPVEDGARCPIDKLAGPPADFLNAALVGLPEIEHRRKGVFQHNPPLPDLPPGPMYRLSSTLSRPSAFALAMGLHAAKAALSSRLRPYEGWSASFPIPPVWIGMLRNGPSTPAAGIPAKQRVAVVVSRR